PISLSLKLPQLATGAPAAGEPLVAAGFPDVAKRLHLSPGSAETLGTLRNSGPESEVENIGDPETLDFTRLQTSSYVRGGNSGGPIYSAEGSKVLGVMTHGKPYQAWSMGAPADALAQLLTRYRGS